MCIRDRRYSLSSGAELVRLNVPNYRNPSLHIWTREMCIRDSPKAGNAERMGCSIVVRQIIEVSIKNGFRTKERLTFIMY